MAQAGDGAADASDMLLVTIVVVCWIVLPLPFAVAVGRAFRSGSETPAPPTGDTAAPDGAIGDLAA
jgi:hypothetical protein